MCAHASVLPSAVITYRDPLDRVVTEHTLSYVRPILEPGWSVLDVGCGGGFVLGELAVEREVMGVDIVDCRKTPVPGFRLWDGVRLPFPDRAFDVALLVFVLHHIPNELKSRVIDEVSRVVRRRIVIFEDTPRTPLDWLAAWLHGHRHRREIGSDASFGFYRQRDWEHFFTTRTDLKLIRSQRLGRFERLWRHPWPRSVFWLEKA